MTIDTITTTSAASLDDDGIRDGARTDNGADGTKADNIIDFAHYANWIGAGTNCAHYAPINLARQITLHILHPDPEHLLRSLVPDDLDPDGADAIFAALHDGRFADEAHESLFPYLAPRLAGAVTHGGDRCDDRDSDHVALAIGHALSLARTVRAIGPDHLIDGGQDDWDLLCGLDEAHQRLLVLADGGDPTVPSVLPIIEPVVAECYALAIKSALGDGPNDVVDQPARGDRS